MKIAFLGDIAVFENGLLRDDWRMGLSDISEYLEQFDAVVANLECPITCQRKSLIPKGIHLKTTEKIVEVLKHLHVSHVSLSNNHIYDYGRAGLNDTIAILKRNGIQYFGIEDQRECLEDAGRIAFHGYCCYSTNGASVNKKVIGLTKKNVLKDLEIDKANGALSILCFHWGDEYSFYPNKKQHDFVKTLAEQYKFFIQGTHTHVIQGIEKVNGSICCYNQGNFLFDDAYSSIVKGIYVKQQKECKESYVSWLEVVDGAVTAFGTRGIVYERPKMKIIDNDFKIRELSRAIEHCDERTYQKKKSLITDKIHNTDSKKEKIKNIITKLNYYSVVAKLLSYFNYVKYIISY